MLKEIFINLKQHVKFVKLLIFSTIKTPAKMGSLRNQNNDQFNLAIIIDFYIPIITKSI